MRLLLINLLAIKSHGLLFFNTKKLSALEQERFYAFSRHNSHGGKATHS